MEKVRWIRDMRRFLPLKGQFVLFGNVRDFHLSEPAPGQIMPAPLTSVLEAELTDVGYAGVVLYNQKNGFSILNGPSDLLEKIDIQQEAGSTASLDNLRANLRHFIAYEEAPVALIIDFASRLVLRNDNLSEAEHRLFTEAFISSHHQYARPYGEKMLPFFNSILWVIENENDLPDWMTVGNPKIRSIPVAKPDRIVRSEVARSLLKSMAGTEDISPEDLSEAETAFVDQTEGLLVIDMMAVIELGRTEGINISQIDDAVRRYKVGVTEDPWSKIDKHKISNGEEFILKRVKGQDHAITHILDIIKRAMTGVGANKRGGRPRGVAFLAGPTGVGKTELAKTVTELLFGDENAYIRFDMSEFSAEHADQRLIGAPPGYLGYDAGGELTNAIRERPFGVILFDEIEKAHPRILDKFLQILDDGVLTSGRGERVYFSESLILFTSNLGINTLDETGALSENVFPQDPLEVIQGKVIEAIQYHFKYVLNRPEILNRLGENIIVFDWIRHDIAKQILDQMISVTLAGITQQNISVSISDEAKRSLSDACLKDLSNGGRGIRNQVEVHLINPLARTLFETDLVPGAHYIIREIITGDTVTSLTLEQVTE